MSERTEAIRVLRELWGDHIAAAAKVSCSKCGALPAVPCSGLRNGVHTARLQTAAQAGQELL